MNPARVLVVDCNAVCYAAYFSQGQLSYDGQDTGIIYGFFNQIRHACMVLQAAHIVFCWDSRQSRRKLLFPGYKSNRQKSNPRLLNCLKQFRRLRVEILPRLGFANNFHATGYEADDLIANVCRRPGPSEDQHYFILSGDQDLYQLLTERVSIYRLGRRRIYSLWDFQSEYGITPLFWPEVKAIAGCTSDALPGIPGIGEKKALDFIRHPSPYERHPIIECGEGYKIRQRNYPLVRLPLEGTPHFDVAWEDLPSFAEWVALCEELGFNSFLKDIADWEAIFACIPPREQALAKIRIGRGKRT